MTHGYEDHISAIPGLMKRYTDSEILISKEDLPLLTNPKLNFSHKSKNPIDFKRILFIFQNNISWRKKKSKLADIFLKFSPRQVTPKEALFLLMMSINVLTQAIHYLKNQLVLLIFREVIMKK